MASICPAMKPLSVPELPLPGGDEAVGQKGGPLWLQEGPGVPGASPDNCAQGYWAAAMCITQPGLLENPGVVGLQEKASSGL